MAAGETEFDVSVERGRVTFIRVVGDVDLSSATDFEVAADGAFEDRPDSIVVDLAGVTFLDSSGLRSLLMLSSRCQAAGVELALRSAPTIVLRVLDATALTDHFTLT